jgi:hypothetical protein
VIESTRDRVNGGRSKVPTCLEVDALAFVAAVVDALVPTAPFEPPRSGLPLFVRLNHCSRVRAMPSF